MYPPGEYDLAGFTVGAVEKSQAARRQPRARGRRADRHRLQRPAFERLFADPQDPTPAPAHARHDGSTRRRREAGRCADGADPHLREAGAGTAGASTTASTPWPTSPAAALIENIIRVVPEAAGPGDRHLVVAAAAGVRLAAARRRRAARGNVAHVQLRRRLRADGRAGRRRRDQCRPRPPRPGALADRPGRARRAPANACASADATMLCGSRCSLPGRGSNLQALLDAPSPAAG